MIRMFYIKFRSQIRVSEYRIPNSAFYFKIKVEINENWVVVVACPSLIYGFWLLLWYLLTIPDSGGYLEDNICTAIYYILLHPRGNSGILNYYDLVFPAACHNPSVRRVWKYQRGNQNPCVEEEQTTQWPKEQAQKDKQRSTKHSHKTKDRVIQTH
jgi:hypothetical protein